MQQLVADLLLGIEERGAVDGCRMILSGYLGSPEIAAVVADFVARAKARNPALLYCCDPVLGDRDRGLFVQRRHPAAGARPTVPAGRYHHPQPFRVRMAVRGEGHDIGSDDRAGANATGARTVDGRRHQRRIVRHAGRRDRDACRSNAQSAWRVRTPKLPISPYGTGDLFAALFAVRARSGIGHAGRARPRRFRHLRRAGAHRAQRDGGNAHRRERRTARSAHSAGSTPSLSG